MKSLFGYLTLVVNIKHLILRVSFTYLNILPAVLLFCFNSILAQNVPGDIVPVSSISTITKAPNRLAVDNNDNVYTSDATLNCILKFDAAGNFVDTIYHNGNPLSIAVNSNGEVFIGDEDSGNILKIGAGGSATVFYSGTQLPSGMVFGTNGLLYVVDSKARTVVVLNSSGNKVLSFGQEHMVYPASIAFDDLNERILVAELGGIGLETQNCNGTMGSKLSIYSFDFNGNLLAEFGCHGKDNGEFQRIRGITIGKCGSIYVSDPFQAEVTVFDQNLDFVTKFGGYGYSTGKVRMPLDIKFDSQERIIISSMNNEKIEVFSIIDTLPSSKIEKKDTTICPGQTTDIIINFTGVAPWTFTYTIDGLSPTNVTTSSNPYTLTATTGGLYEITAISDTVGAGTCFMGSAVIRMANQLPTANITTGNINLCAGETANINIALTGKSPWTFTYTIDGLNPTNVTTSDSNYTFSTSNPGLYNVIALNDSLCAGSSFTGNTNVMVHPFPTETFNNNILSVEACEGEIVNLPVELTGTAPWSFTYTKNGANPTIVFTSTPTNNISISETGSYTISTVTDSFCVVSNLTDSVAVTIHPKPTTDLQAHNSTICAGTDMKMLVDLTGNAPWSFTYTINDADTTTITNIIDNNTYFNASQAGYYQIIAASDANCIASNFYGYHTISLLDVPVITLLSLTDVTCYGGNDGRATYSITGGTPPYTESWGGDDFNNLVWDDHQVIVTDANNCRSDLWVDPMQPPQLILTPTLTDATCGNANGTALLNITGGVAPYIQDWGSADPLALPGGNYMVIVTDSKGCVMSETVTILGDTTISDFTYTTNGMQVFFTNNSQNAVSYQWQFGDGNTSTNPNPIYTYSAPGIYYVTLTAYSNGCPNIIFTDTIDFSLVAVKETILKGSFNLYPNPSNGNITLEINNPNGKEVSMDIFSITGQLVYAKKFNETEIVHHFDISNHVSGMYMVKFLMDEEIIIQRLIINK